MYNWRFSFWYTLCMKGGTKNESGEGIKRRIAANLLVLVSFILVSFGGLPARGQGAKILINPNAGSFSVESTFDVSIFVDTGGDTVNAVDVQVKFPPDKLQVINPSAGTSFISLWLQQPTFSNKDGTISFVGGVPEKGINTSAGLVSTITFRARAPGRAVMEISEKSAVLAADGKGTNILGSIGKANFTIVSKTPGGPEVFSTTHPDQDQWYNNNNVTVAWDDEEGVSGYSYILSRNPAEIPDNINDSEQSSINFTDLKDGVLYLHIKQQRAGLYGDTTHYQIKIDTEPPAQFKPKVELLTAQIARQAVVEFFTTDALSGINRYEVAVFDRTKESGEAPFFVEATSPYRVPDIIPGARLSLIVRAFDNAGNARDGTIGINNLNLFVSLLRDNWIGLVIALVILAFLTWHLRTAHHRRKSR